MVNYPREKLLFCYLGNNHVKPQTTQIQTDNLLFRWKFEVLCQLCNFLITAPRTEESELHTAHDRIRFTIIRLIFAESITIHFSGLRPRNETLRKLTTRRVLYVIKVRLLCRDEIAQPAAHVRSRQFLRQWRHKRIDQCSTDGNFWFLRISAMTSASNLLCDPIFILISWEIRSCQSVHALSMH